MRCWTGGPIGSFARREAQADSDIDVVVVRPCGIDEDNEPWAATIDQWRIDIQRLTGNTVEILEVSADEAATAHSPLWAAIRRDGQVVHGLGLDELRGVRRG